MGFFGNGSESLVESATKGERKKFNEVIDFCLAQKETIAIIVYDFDRLQRSFKEFWMLKELVLAEKLEFYLLIQVKHFQQFK